MSRGINKKGRSKSGPRFVQLFHYVMDTPAWRSLSPNERCVLLEIARRYDGSNNGRLGLGVREAADLCNINKDTASRAFHALHERGLIECAQAGHFDFKQRHAAEWRLTWCRCDRTGASPSKAFVTWSPPAAQSAPKSKTRSETRGQVVRNGGTDGAAETRSVPSFRTDLRVVA